MLIVKVLSMDVNFICPVLCWNSCVVVLQALDWNLCPETPISWLKLYSQVEAQTDGENFLVPQFSQETYIQITQVCSHCITNTVKTNVTLRSRLLLKNSSFWPLTRVCFSCWICVWWTSTRWTTATVFLLQLPSATSPRLTLFIKSRVNFGFFNHLNKFRFQLPVNGN